MYLNATFYQGNPAAQTSLFRIGLPIAAKNKRGRLTVHLETSCNVYEKFVAISEIITETFFAVI